MYLVQKKYTPRDSDNKSELQLTDDIAAPSGYVKDTKNITRIPLKFP